MGGISNFYFTLSFSEQNSCSKHYEHTNHLVTDFFPEDGEDQEENDPTCEHLDPKLLDFTPDVIWIRSVRPSESDCWAAADTGGHLYSPDPGHSSQQRGVTLGKSENLISYHQVVKCEDN